MNVKTKISKIYVVELTEEDKERYLKRMQETDMDNHPYSILGEIYNALREAR